MSVRIRKGDVVEVIAGKNKGARGTVLRVDARSHKVTVRSLTCR